MRAAVLFTLLVSTVCAGCESRQPVGDDGDGGVAPLDVSVQADGADPKPISWARSFGGQHNDTARRVVVDREGNTYIAGVFLGSFAVDGKAIEAKGSFDVLLMKLDPRGRVLWASSAGGAGDDYVLGLELHPDGKRLTVVGSYERSFTFDRSTITAAGRSAYLLTLSTTGQVHSLVGPTSSSKEGFVLPEDIVVMPNGELHLAGTMRGAYRFGSLAVDTKGPMTGFVAVYKGGFTQVKLLGGQEARIASVAVNSAMQRTVVGIHSGRASFDELTWECKGTQDGFVARLDQQGKVLWAKQIGGGGHDIAHRLVVGPQGSMRVLGRFHESISLGAETLRTSSAAGASFMVHLDETGALSKAKKIADGRVYIYDAVFDAGGTLHAVGTMADEIVVGGKDVPARHLEDAFFMQIDPSGTISAARVMGGIWDDYAYGVALGPNGEAVVVGEYRESMVFGQHTLTSVGASDGFVWRLR